MPVENLDSMIVGFLAPRAFWKTSFTGEVIGGLHSSLYLAGVPGAAAAPAPGLTGAALTSYPGQLFFPATVANKEIRLHRLEAASSSSGVSMLRLNDRLWHNSGLNVASTASQTIDSVAFPARDITGTVNGEGVQVALEYSTTSTGGATTASVSYTNSAGTAGRTGSITIPATAVAGTFLPMSLQSGDTGVRSVQTFTFAAVQTSAVVHLVAYRSIASLLLPSSGVGADRDGLSMGIPRMYDGSVPWLVYLLSTTSGGLVHGSITYLQV